MIGGLPLRLLAYTDSSEVGGAEIALGYLLRALSAEIETGVLVTDLHVGEAIAAMRPGTRVLKVRAPVGSCDLRSLEAHARAIRRFAPDLLHANQTWPWACAYGEIAGLLLPGVHVVAVDHLPVAGSLPRARVLARRLLARRLHAHVAVGEQCARLVEDIVGLPPRSVVAVANGVPRHGTDVIAPDRAPGPVIGSLGRLTDQKGYDMLVRVMPKLPGVTLVLVGDGPQRPALERLASELDVADRVNVTGWRTNARAYLSTFDIFAMPSRWEGMPLGILEAMHAGLPVVATDVGSAAEPVCDGVTGYAIAVDDLSSLGERLATLLADPELRRDMGERGRARAVELYTDLAMARRYEAVYAKVLAGGRRERRAPDLLGAGGSTIR